MKGRISFKRDGVQLNGTIFLPMLDEGAECRCPAICICHGIPRVAKTVEEKGYPAVAQEFSSRGFVSLIFNFSGTRGSEGEFSLSGWSEDLFKAIDLLSSREEVDENAIGVVGFSGGAIVAIHNAASDERIKMVVSCSCPANLFRSRLLRDAKIKMNKKEMEAYIKRNENVSVGAGGLDVALRKFEEESSKFNPVELVDKIHPRPVLIVHGERDEIVDVSSAYELYEKAKHPKDIFVVPGQGHGIRESAEVISFIADFAYDKMKIEDKTGNSN
jgi:dipeptidyl aminopeptidase/acylaminoacyl peptidase